MSALEHELDRRGLIYREPALTLHLANLAQPFLPASKPANVEWQFKIVLDPVVNAFSLPGGSVYVTSGLLAALENNDQLSVVLAHEIAHVASRHMYLTLRASRKRQLAKSTLELAPISAPGGILLPLAIALGLSETAADATAYGYSRKFEFEADDLTAAAFAKLNKDAMQIARCLDLAAARPDPEQVPAFYSDPKWSALRTAHLRLATNISPHADEDAYLGQVASAIRRNIQFDLITHRFRTAVAAAKRLVSGAAPNPEDLCLLAESYFALGPRSESPQASQAASPSKPIRNASKWTEEEEFQHLAATPDGQAALHENQAKAESLFRRASAADTRLARPHAGLGMLFEQMSRKSDAATEYRQFLELAPQAPDRARIERRLAAL